MSKVTALEIKKALALYHPKDYFITECKTCSTYFPDPQGLLKFDGLAMTRSYTSPCITGYEIKVSRSDFLGDNKWHLYLQYCNEFYFVVPAGLISKNEIPENTGLIYYYPDTGKLLKKKKAIYRKIEEPVGVYKYIIYSRLEQDRTPFYEDRAEYAKDYLADKIQKRKIGTQFGSKMAKELRECQDRLEKLQDVERELTLLHKIEDVLERHRVFSIWQWRSNVDYSMKELENALNSSYPKDLDYVEIDLQRTLQRIQKIKIEHEKDGEGST